MLLMLAVTFSETLFPVENLLGYSAQLHLKGDDATDLLERTVTCRVDDMAPGDTRPGALLTPQGKIIADFILYRTEEGYTLWLHNDALADMEKRMKLFRLRKKVDIEAVPSTDKLDCDDGSRIVSGIAAFGRDFGAAEVFPTDINLDHREGIDYKKGCFVGQEVASRMMRRGKIRKRTVSLEGVSLTKDAQIKAGDAVIGTITSVAGANGLALIRLDRLKVAQTSGLDLISDGERVLIKAQDWLAQEMEALEA